MYIGRDALRCVRCVDHHTTKMLEIFPLQAVKSRAGELLSDMLHSGPMKVAMIVSAIVFTQTSILKFSYFLNNVIRILQYDLKIGNFL